MKHLLVIALAGATFSAIAEDVGVYDADTKTLTYDLAADATEAKAFTAYGTVEKVVKKGAGKLTVTPLNTDFNGAIDIEEGIFSAGSTDKKATTVLGKAAITVRSGGQFRSTQTSENQWSHYFTGCTFAIEGAGPDGSGAIYCCQSSGNADRGIPSTTLTGPATVGGSRRWGFGGTLDMNGHTLTNKTGAEFMWTGMTIKNPGHFVQDNTWSYITLEGQGFTTGADHVFTLGANGAKLNYWSNGSANNWTLRAATNAYIQVSSGNNPDGVNRWLGPIEIAGGSTLSLIHHYSSDWSAGNKSLTLSGEISGAGKLRTSHTADSEKTLTITLNHENTYTGGTSIESKSTLLCAKADKSIPTAGGLKISNGLVQLFTGTAGGWSLENAHALFDVFAPSDGCASKLSLHTPADVIVTDTLPFGPTAKGVGHSGEGTLISTGGFTGNQTLVNRGGTWKISGERRDYLLAGFNALAGSLVFEDAGYMWMSNKAWTVETDYTADQPKVVFKGNTVLDGYPAGKRTIGGKLVAVDVTMAVAGWTAGKRGLVEIEEGAVVSNRMHIGQGSRTVGAVHQHGGKMFETALNEHDGHWGEYGYGGYLITGGYLQIGHCSNIGSRQGGTGILDLRGGEAKAINAFFLGSGGTGIVHVTGGKFTANENMVMGQLEWAQSGDISGRSILTIAGEEAEAVVEGSVNLCQRTNGAAAFVNLNAGVLAASSFHMRNYWSETGWGKHYGTKPNERGHGYVNFNGGTLRARRSAGFFNTDPSVCIDRVTVYEKGATIDTAGYNPTLNFPLDRPLGYGVKAIVLPAGFANTNYLGRQAIAIQGGDANTIEAIAITDYDEATRTISSVEIVTPGSGYAAGDTVRAFVQDCKHDKSTELAVTLGENIGGGLTKIGAGTLTLSATNTYAGATIVSNGTLKVAVEEALPEGNAITVVAGQGMLDLTATGLPEGRTLAIDVGALPQGRPATHAARHLTLVKGLKAKPAYTLVGALPYPWQVVYRANGTLEATCQVGFSILVR